MAQSVVLTTSGASFMSGAGTMFPAMPIRYCLFSYDYRMDPYVLPTSGMTSILSADTTSAVGLTFGDVIYNIDTLSLSAYSVSNNEFLLYDSNQTGTSTISNNRFDGTSYITLLNGRPLSHAISGTSIVYSYPNWTVNGYTIVSGSNVVPTGYSTSRDKYFRVNSFAPISSAAGGQAAGLFKVIIDNQKGNFKFNKILLYAARILSGGVEDTSIDPVLVGMAYLNSPVIKSNDGTNLNFFEGDIQVQFSANNYFGNVSYLNNNAFNYVGGEQLLWFDGKVALGTSAIPGSWLGRAKLHITESNTAIPMIRITNDNDDSYVDSYLSEVLYQNTETHKTSKPNFITYFETSGSSRYSKAGISLDSVNAIRTFSLSFIDTLSGAVNTSWTSTYGGWVETSNFRFDSNTLATFRSVNNTFGTLVLGLDAPNMFEHRNKMLTVHGGTLLVGTNLLSGDNNIVTPNLSANGYIIATNIYSKNNLIADGNLNVTGNINATAGFNYLGYTHFQTSADFHTPVKIFTTNDISIPSLSANGYITGANIYSKNNLVADGNFNLTGNMNATLGIISLGTLKVDTSASFVAPVSMNQRLTSTNSISAAGSVSAYDGFYELDRGIANGYWTTYTPTLTNQTSLTATTNNVASYTIIGKTLYLNFNVDFQQTGGGGYIRLTLPSGCVVGNAATFNTIFGYAHINTTTDSIGYVKADAGNNYVEVHLVNGAGFDNSVSIDIHGFIVLPVA